MAQQDFYSKYEYRLVDGIPKERYKFFGWLDEDFTTLTANTRNEVSGTIVLKCRHGKSIQLDLGSKMLLDYLINTVGTMFRSLSLMDCFGF